MSPLLRQLLVSCVLLWAALPQSEALPSQPPSPGYAPVLREIAVQEVQRRARERLVTQVINVQQELVTVTNRVTVTSTQFQTCTAVVPGTPPCPTLQTAVTASAITTATPEVREPSQDKSSTSTNVPVLLPSCNCPGEDTDLPTLLGDGYRLFTRRTPRLLDQEQPQAVIVLTLTTTLVDTVTETVLNTATTVGLTYGGCVPTDALTTTACAGA